MYEILRKIKTVLTGWKLSDIFHNSNKGYCVYDKPIIGFFFPSCGYSYPKHTYTKLGRWFEDAPDIVSLLKLFWYIPAWVVFVMFNIFWYIIELFLPSSVKSWL